MTTQKKLHSFLNDSTVAESNRNSNGFAAYMYAYPLIMTGVTERLASNSVSTPTSGSAPINQFGFQTEFPSSEFTAVVLPSTSTLYASAFLNLKNEPIIMHIPDLGGRYFVMPLLDGWTNVNKNSPSTRTGSLEGDYVIVGPDDNRDYSGGGRTVIKMDTNTAWNVGRIYTDGTEKDLAFINREIYPNLTLTPWSKRNDNDYQPPSNLPFDPMAGGFVSPITEIYQMDMVSYFSNLAALMNYNPALLPQDRKMVEILKEVGFRFTEEEGVIFEHTKLSKQDMLSAKAAKEFLGEPDKKPPMRTHKDKNYWTFASEVSTGDFGDDYKYRAHIARWAFGANIVKECIYGYAIKDSHGNDLDGVNNYTLHFPELPPVSKKAFWSVTIYNADGTLVTNQSAINAGVDYNAIGMPMIQAHNGRKNLDDSMTLYLQPNPPTEDDAFQNWIPTPAEGGVFIVFLRMYIPKLLPKPVDGNYVVEGNWIPPGIKKVENTN